MRMLPIRFTLLAVLFGPVQFINAQQTPSPDRPISEAERKEVIDGVLDKIVANYVFPDVGKKMAEAIRARQEKKEYDAITSSREFARVLTDHLREVCKDKHLGVRYNAEPLPKDFDRGPSPAEEKRQRQNEILDPLLRAGELEQADLQHRISWR